ncbi:MAG: hypothetical protein IKN83_04680 [Bacteroidaceae bacterium]|nr:hypothetical protein [Bacteroidaceae bacterium]
MSKKNVCGFLLLLFSSLVFIACHQEDDSVRVYYDDLLENHLDSAVIVAETTNLDSLSEKERAYFAIFREEVKVRKNMVIADTTELARACKYFKSKNDKKNQAWCLIELAEYYSAKGDYRRMFFHASKALGLSNKMNDSYLQGVSHSLLGRCFSVATLYEKSKEEYLFACEKARECGNRRLEALSTFRKGEAEWALDSLKQSVISMIKGYELAKDLNNNILVAEFCAGIADHLLYSWQDRSDNEQLLKYAKESVQYNSKENNYWGFQVLGKAYALCGKIDSAIVYLEKSIDSPKPSIKYASYLAMADVEFARKNLAQSLEYERLSTAWKDSIELQNRSKSVLIADKEWMMTLEEEKHGKLHHYILITSLLLIFIFITFLFQRKRLRATRHLLEERIKEDKEREAMRKEVNQVEAAIVDTYAWQKADIFAKMKRVIQGQKEGLETKEHLSEVDWVSIIETSDLVYHGICRLLRKEYGMKENDIRFCALVLSPVSLFDFQFLYNRSESAAYQRERYILQHRFGITDKDKRLKDVLLEMVQKEI